MIVYKNTCRFRIQSLVWVIKYPLKSAVIANQGSSEIFSFSLYKLFLAQVVCFLVETHKALEFAGLMLAPIHEILNIKKSVAQEFMKNGRSDASTAAGNSFYNLNGCSRRFFNNNHLVFMGTFSSFSFLILYFWTSIWYSVTSTCYII